MTGLELALATVIVAVGASVQGVIGFGLGLIGAPLLVLFEPDLVPGPLLFAVLPLTFLVALRERGALDLHGLRWAFAGRVAGTVAGTVAVASLPHRPLVFLVGGVVLGAVVLSVSGWHVRPTNRTLLTAGATSGFMGTATSIGGPPMAIVYQREDGPQLRSTLALFYLLGVCLSLVTLTVAGEFGGTELRAGAVLLPGVLLGFAGSRRLARVLDRGYTRSAVLAASAVAAATLLLTELL